jgi:hypothetical protein
MILTFGTRSFSVMPAESGHPGGLRWADEKEKMGIICSVRTTSTPSGGVPAAWLRAAALRSYGKYSLSETDVQQSANDANGAISLKKSTNARKQAFCGNIVVRNKTIRITCFRK